MDVGQADLLEPRLDQIAGHLLVLRAGNPPPILVPVVAAPARDRDDVVHRRLHLKAADVRVSAIGWAERWRREKRVLPDQPLRIEKRLKRMVPGAAIRPPASRQRDAPAAAHPPRARRRWRENNRQQTRRSRKSWCHGWDL